MLRGCDLRGPTLSTLRSPGVVWMVIVVGNGRHRVLWAAG